MSDFETGRRGFLQATASTLVGAQLFAPALARALATPAARRTGTIEDVEHVVIFMQENRSFDHYFGTMAGVRGFADPNPFRLPSGAPVWCQPDGKGRTVGPFAYDIEKTSFSVMKSLDHHWASGHAAWNEGRYDNWVPAKGGLTMGHLTRHDIPYHFALADAFTVCDAYHSSLQGPTAPNRLYLMTGSVDHHATGGGPVTDNIDITQLPNGVTFGRGWKTYAERLQDAGISWQLYRQGTDRLSDDNSDGGMNTLAAFAAFQESRPGDPLYHRGMEPRRLDQLKRDVEQDKLAQVSWIVPPRIFCEHPKWPPAFGVEYIARILDALTANPVVWSKTALLIMYDENDGFFDHMPPPVAPFGRDQGLSTVPTDDERDPRSGQPYGLGMRVPMLAISPWSRGGYVCSEVFDHTSVIRFLETRFGVHEPNISAWRRTVCGDLTSAFDFTAPSAAVPRALALRSAGSALPDQARFDAYKAVVGKRPKPTVPAAQPMPTVEPGGKKARPLPYALSVDLKSIAGAVRLDFVNAGKAGAAFSVCDRLRPHLAPRRYTVSAGASLSDEWPLLDTAHALEVQGPAGFVRSFSGTGEPAFTVHVRSLADHVVLAITQHGATPIRIGDAYAGRTVEIAPKRGERAEHRVAVAANGHWYDLTVEAPGHSERFAGHVETGRASISDPRMNGDRQAAGVAGGAEVHRELKTPPTG
ncbi:phosphocholine-specific phospholipase C [Sphingomonas sp. PL20]|uniref:phosphocholine-specific phospholipase C n=1 Tax=Sphingomonas sp. PL20 TaxID=2760712 RepID=UPI001AE3FA17